MSNLFTVSNILYIISSIEELLYMSEYPLSPEIFYTSNSIKINFSLKNGISEVTIGDGECGTFNYFFDNKQDPSRFHFYTKEITDTNGSFHKAFRSIRSLDREYCDRVKSQDTSIDRASFGLEAVN
jgi:hypothetical protein